MPRRNYPRWKTSKAVRINVNAEKPEFSEMDRQGWDINPTSSKPLNGTALNTFQSRFGRKKPGKIERNLQSDIIEFHNVHVIDANSAIVFAIPNGEKRHPVVAKMLSGINAKDRELLETKDKLRPFGQGLLPGAPDLILCTSGGVIDFIEIKKPGYKNLIDGGLSKQQKLFKFAIESIGFNYHRIESVHQYIKILNVRNIELLININ